MPKKTIYLTDVQKNTVTNIVTSGTAELLHKLNKAQLDGAEPKKVCKLVDMLPAKIQWTFNTLQGLPDGERMELTALAVATSRILIELVTLPQPYTLSALTQVQSNNTGLFSRGSNTAAKLSEIFKDKKMPSLVFTTQGKKKMVSL